MTIRYCRSRGFDRPSEVVPEAEALSRRQVYRVHLRGEQVERAEYLEQGVVARVIYVRAAPLDARHLARHAPGDAVDSRRRDGHHAAAQRCGRYHVPVHGGLQCGGIAHGPAKRWACGVHWWFHRAQR